MKYTKFTIKTGSKGPIIGRINYRFRDRKLLDAFNQALKASKLPAERLVEQMLRHCLTDTGHLEALEGK